MNLQPFYRKNDSVTVKGNGRGKTNDHISGAGTDSGAGIVGRNWCLPSGNWMTEEQQDAVI